VNPSLALVDKELTAPPLLRLLDYWETKRGPRRFPSRRDIDPLDFVYILGNVGLIDVLREPLRFRIRLFGENLVHKIGVEVTGKLLDELPLPELRDHFTLRCRQIVERGAPYRTRGDYFLDEHSSLHELLVLPLSEDGAEISMLLFAFWFADQGQRRGAAR
jgi:hypothetical protein